MTAEICFYDRGIIETERQRDINQQRRLSGELAMRVEREIEREMQVAESRCKTGKGRNRERE